MRVWTTTERGHTCKSLLNGLFPATPLRRCPLNVTSLTGAARARSAVPLKSNSQVDKSRRRQKSYRWIEDNKEDKVVQWQCWSRWQLAMLGPSPPAVSRPAWAVWPKVPGLCIWPMACTLCMEVGDDVEQYVEHSWAAQGAH